MVAAAAGFDRRRWLVESRAIEQEWGTGMKAARWTAAGVLMLVVALAGNVSANSGGPTTTVPEYLDYLTELREGFKEGEPKPLSRREQQLFDNADRDIRKILAEVDSVEDLSRDASMALYNSQEQIQAILTGAEDTRVLCKREARAGTNFRQTRCVNAATRQVEQEAAQELLRRFPTWFRTPGTN